jgi:sporulation protein YlmC with PRC-barrel domain
VILLSDLLEAEVRAEDGRKLGRVYDVRVRKLGHRNPDGHSLKVVGVVIGGRGIRERFGLDTAKVERPIADREVIAWERIVSFDAGDARVVVRDP